MIKNRKIQLSKKMLSDSLIELLKSKHISDITISELCQKADINRSTFYKYYHSVLDLLQEIEDTILSYFKEVLNQLGDHMITNVSFSILERLFDYMHMHQVYLKVLLSETTHSELEGKIIEVFQHQIHGNYQTLSPLEDVKLVYVLHGSLALIKSWIKGEVTYSSYEITKMIIEYGQALMLKTSR